MRNFHRSSFVIVIGILVVAFAVPAQAATAVRRKTVTAPPPTTTTNTTKTFVSPK